MTTINLLQSYILTLTYPLASVVRLRETYNQPTVIQLTIQISLDTTTYRSFYPQPSILTAGRDRSSDWKEEIVGGSDQAPQGSSGILRLA